MFITSRESAMFPFAQSAEPSLRGLSCPRLPGPPCLSGGSRCPEHISALKNLRSEQMSEFYWVLCRFSRIRWKAAWRENLYVVVYMDEYAIRSIISRDPYRSLWNR